MAHCDKCKRGDCKRCEREGIELVTDVIKHRLSTLFLTVAPPMHLPGPADVIIYASKRPDSTEVVRLLCHSCMLKKPCDFFRDILEYTRIVSRRPTVRPPSVVLDRNSFFMEPDGEGGFLGPAARTIYQDIKRGSITGLKRQSVLENYLGKNKQDPVTVAGAATRRVTVIDPKDEPQEKQEARKETSQPDLESFEERDRPASPIVNFLEAERRETADERETLVNFHRKGVPVGKYYVKLKLLSWTESMLYGIMEYIYTDRCHLTVHDLPLVYAAADKMMLTSFTTAVRQRDPVPYVRFAMENEDNRKAILKLCQLARCEELEKVQRVCESFTYERGKGGKNVHMLVFHSAKRLGRHEDIFAQGFHDYCGFHFCILQDLPPAYKHGYPEECFKNPQWTRSRRSLLNTYGLVIGPPGSKSERDAKDLEYIVIARQPQGFKEMKKEANLDEWCTHPKEQKNKHKVWRIYLFGSEIAKACYSFFRHAASLSHRPLSPEAFSLRMVSGLIVGDMLVEILKKAIPQGLQVVQGRGSGYFIGGFNYGNHIDLSGHPIKILEGVKSIPKDMIGRACLRIDYPSERTFITYMSASTTVGVQIEATCRLFFVKAVDDLIGMLEYATGMNLDSYVPWDETRTMVELVRSIEPF